MILNHFFGRVLQALAFTLKYHSQTLWSRNFCCKIIIMKSFAIHTLGCKTNQLESAMISDSLIKEGYQLVKFNEKADFYIINTCSVTAKSDSESMYYIRKAKRTNPDAKIIVTGCLAQLKPEEIEADIILGNAQKQDLLEYMEAGKGFVSDIMDETEFRYKKVFSNEGKTRANIKIQDGCNNRCTYCIIPYARGKSRSNSVQNILEQIQIYTEQGFKELVLTGIHIGQWGKDFSPEMTFLDLLSEIEKNTTARIRLGSLEPNEINDELIDFLANSDKFAHHLHISLQNANDEILKLMNRHYNIFYVKKIMEKLKSKMPDISLGCDVITGFPTETDEQFKNGLKNLQEMPFSYMHIFPYSVREGTPAAKMEQVQDSTKTIRAKALRELAKSKKENFITNLIGQNLEVLVENKRDKSGKLKGISSNYLQVVFDGGEELKKTIIPINAVGFEADIVLGKVSTK